MKKILSILLAACMAVSLVSCSSGSTFTVGEFCSQYNNVISTLKSDKGLAYSVDKYVGVDSISTIPDSGKLVLNSADMYFSTSGGVINSNSKIDEITIKILSKNDTDPIGIYYIIFLYAALSSATPEQQEQVKNYYTNKADSLPDMDNMEVIDCGYGIFKVRYGKKSGVNYLGRYEDDERTCVELDKNGKATIAIRGQSSDYLWRVSGDIVEVFMDTTEPQVMCRGTIKNNSIDVDYFYGVDFSSANESMRLVKS